MLSVKRVLTKVLSYLKGVDNHIKEVGDFVTSQGWSGSWYYRKWESGKVEAWTTATATASTWAVWASPIRYRDIAVSIPSGIFTAIPTIVASSGPTTQSWVVNANASSMTNINMRLATVTSTSISPYARLYAIQY